MRRWRVIKGHPKYLVSNDGYVKNRETGQILSRNHLRGGYRSVILDGVALKIHRLVAIAFVPNDDPENKTNVDHIDGDKLNNDSTNLEWVTIKENTRRGYITGKNHVTKKSVIQLDLDGNEIARFESLKEAREKTGIDDTAIVKVCRGVRKTAGKCKWKYIDDENSNEESDEEIDLSDFIPVNDFPTSLISKYGKIFGTFKNEIRKTQINPDGYEQISLANNKIKKTFLVHKLVAEHFLPKIEGKNYVNHIDGNKLNNHVDNLEWVTNSENLLHAHAMKRLANSKKIKKEVADEIVEVDDNTDNNKSDTKIIVRSKKKVKSETKSTISKGKTITVTKNINSNKKIIVKKTSNS